MPSPRPLTPGIAPQSENPAVEAIEFNGNMLAMIVRANFASPGIHFFTPDESSQQLGFMKHPSGKIIDAHIHEPVARQVEYSKEVLFIRKGRLRVDFYSEAQDYLESRILEQGDVILLVNGGHGFEVLEDLEMFEAKQGPYAGARDKRRIDGVARHKIRYTRGPQNE